MPQRNRYAKPTAASNPKPKWRNDQRSIHRICPQDTSPLFKLPSELRAKIWRMALPYSEERVFSSSSKHVHWDSSTCDENSSVCDEHSSIADEHSSITDEQSSTTTGNRSNKKRQVSEIPTIENRSRLVIWRTGNLGLLRVCKRVEVEATRVFFASNAFECVINGLNPSLAIQYKFTPDESILRDPRRRRRGPGLRNLRTIPRKYCRLIPRWVLSFTTFRGLEFDLLQNRDALFETRNQVSDRDEREMHKTRRKQHREQVLFGLDWWLRLSDAYESAHRSVNVVALRFFPEWDFDEYDSPDRLLKTRVLKNIPHSIYPQGTK